MASNLETEFLTLCAWSNFAVAIVEIADSIFYHTINTSEFEVEPPDFDVATSRKHHTLTLRRLHLHIEILENLKHFKWYFTDQFKISYFHTVPKGGKSTENV